MLNEINKDYFDSVKKSILDYILKDDNEMRRLGIQQVLDRPIDWGDDYYKGIEPNEEWKHNVMMARIDDNVKKVHTMLHSVSKRNAAADLFGAGIIIAPLSSLDTNTPPRE